MTYNLADVLRRETPLRIIKVKVKSVDTVNRRATVTYNGADIPNVAYHDHYVPAANDIADAVVMETRGMILMGKQTMIAAPVEPTITPINGAVSASWQYNADTGAWSQPNPKTWGGDQQVALFYPASFGTAVAGKLLTGFTIKLQPVADTWATLDLLSSATNTSQPGSYVSSAQFYSERLVAGALTAVSLPLSWAEAFGAGTAVGIGIHSDLYTGQVDTTVANQGQIVASYSN